MEENKMYKQKFYLIQRGTIRVNPQEKIRFLSGRDDALIDPDYMGSAEFEWGAIPRAYVRVLNRYHEYSIHDTGLKTVQGKTLYLFCIDKYYNEIWKVLDINV